MENNFLPMTIHAEDVIIDYDNKNLCKSFILVGFDLHADGDMELDIFHFDLDQLGEVIAAGIDSKGRRFGWAVYRRCSGKKGDMIPPRTGSKIT